MSSSYSLLTFPYNSSFSKTLITSTTKKCYLKSSTKIVTKLVKDDNSHNSNGDKNREPCNLNRRNILLGIGGIYGATNTFSGHSTSLATPIEPDVRNCAPTNFPRMGPADLDCCPPTPRTIMDFKYNDNQDLRVRVPAHLVDEAYIEKYSRAMALMRNLPADDPRNFTQQANIHCAYCDASYNQLGFPNLIYQVHDDWLFFPFHRCYLYFFEKILGKLIDDPTFALPFWNWDHPDGMYMPTIYTDPNSSLYDPFRNQAHLPPTLMDLAFDGDDPDDNISPGDLINANLAVMHRNVVTNGKNATLFLGRPYRAGDPTTPGGGSIERVPHGSIHGWTGDPRQEPFRIDMGAFYSAGRDPIFYAHHSNIDRLWSVWKTLGGKRQDFTDPDFLDAPFYFYDENAQLVRIRVRDCLDTKQLGYVYQEVDLPWLNFQPKPANNSNNQLLQQNSIPTITFPKQLDSTIHTMVVRPKKSRTEVEKENEEEILVINVEMVRMDRYHKFDVYINDNEENPPRQKRINTEYAGSFAMMPMRRMGTMTSTFTLGVQDLISDLGADDDDMLSVTLVPRSGQDSINILDIKIDYMQY